MADHDALALQLLEFVPNATPEQATQYLSAHNWDLDSAAASLMADMEEGEDNAAAPESSSASQAAPPGYTGPRTLDGRPAPQAASSSRSKPAAKKKGLATLSSLGGGNDHDDDDSDDDDDDDDPRRTYAGGEKSGLALQDPNQGRPDPKSIINDLLAKAKSQARRPEAESPAGPSTPSTFSGSGQTLGGEGVASRTIPDPSAAGRSPQEPAASNGPVQERVLHLWRDGFSIDDGPLRRFDDPENADALRMIQQGRAPVHLMNVRYDEPLDVKLQQHEENFRQLPKVYKPFGGEGRRLGSPVPGDGGATATASATTPAAAAAASSSAPPTSSSAVSVDDSQPTISIRIQMPDGTRLPARFNTTHTVNDVYDFIVRSSPELQAGGWVLATTFPNKDHTDKSLVLGDMAEFKKGGTAMVKRST
ncbi:UBX domain-containing protein 1 [Apiospora kogelbergensis]|uniref:UBX domain-containing protein 1 n=1 Tax=Apiospora kogelbergensis TaxID=1337665 RepID=UPI003132846E